MNTLLKPLSLLLIAVTALRAVCPTPTGTYSWANAIPVSYAYPTYVGPPCWVHQSASGLGIQGDIDAAFNQWTHANQNQNSTNTTFYFSTSGTWNVYVLRVADPSACGTSVAAQTYSAIYGGTSTVAFASTYFYLGSNSTLGFPNYDETASNYHAFIQKVMAHEIGHPMGIDDQPLSGGVCGGQTSGQSVMNAACGTNDSADNMPAPTIGIPTCDNQSVS